jgi:predicted NAD/FAD-binding protein
MKIAILGTGVTGLGAAYALHSVHDVVVYEKDRRIGGHSNTVTIDYDGLSMDVDTGFIVYNLKNYPNLIGLLDALDVQSLPTDMSFAFSGGGLEWSSNFPRGVFAQKRNIANPSFLRMLLDMQRFNRQGLEDLESGRLDDLTLGGYLRLRKFSKAFEEKYLLPMGAAIWSSTEGKVADFPAESFLRFFANHNLLQVVQPSWRTIKGGSRSYVDRLRALLGDRIRASAGDITVRRTRGRVEVTDGQGQTELFDQVLMACHSDESLKALTDADADERAFLGAIRYAPNTAYLHRDPALMPTRKAAWGSWNVLNDLKGPNGEPAEGVVSYWMNPLQDLDPKRPLFVTLNPPTAPDPALTFGVYDYAHPQFDRAALASQRQFNRIQGRGGVWHAGAWLGYGFHEDGLTSGLRAALALGGQVPWDFVDHRIAGGPLPTFETPSLARSASTRA